MFEQKITKGPKGMVGGMHTAPSIRGGNLGSLRFLLLRFPGCGPRPGGGRTAFTLVEMLAVLAIVCLLAVLVLGITSHVQRAAREARARTDLELIRTALEESKLKYGSYPADLTSGDVTHWLPTGFTFKDPWGAGYQYASRTNAYSLYSMGPDTNDANDNIVSGR